MSVFKIDLHMHTLCSDGTDSVKELIEKLAKTNIKVFSITDHDTAEAARIIENSDELKTMILENGMQFIPGAEWSCIYNGEKIHILSYNFDPFCAEIQELEQMEHAMVLANNSERIKRCEDAGFVFSQDSKKYMSEKANLRKPDIARCLVNDGYFSSIDEACRTILKSKNEIKYRLDAKIVIPKLKAIGTEVVWAHSLGGVGESKRSLETVESLISGMKEIGLTGLECYYSMFNRDEIKSLLNLADKHGLIVTCGSDYHGKSKKVSLGEHCSEGLDIDYESLKQI